MNIRKLSSSEQFLARQTFLGPTGPVGPIGPAGIPPNKKLVTIFCKKDYGFLKSGEYIMGFIYEPLDSEHIVFFSFISEDDKMSINLNEKEANEYFIWRSNDLRDHKLGSMGMCD